MRNDKQYYPIAIQIVIVNLFVVGSEGAYPERTPSVLFGQRPRLMPPGDDVLRQTRLVPQLEREAAALPPPIIRMAGPGESGAACLALPTPPTGAWFTSVMNRIAAWQGICQKTCATMTRALDDA